MKIVMVDQDGVLLDKSYRVAADIKDFFRDLPAGLKIVPNSDTPIRRITNNFRIAAGLQADIIIGEKGAVVYCNGETHCNANVQGIPSFLDNLGKTFDRLDCDIVVGDSATWIREGKRFTPNRRMLIIDGLRDQTVGFYLRTTMALPVWMIDGLTLALLR